MSQVKVHGHKRKMCCHKKLRETYEPEDRVQSGSADVQNPQHIDAVVPPSPNPGPRTRPQPAIGHYDAMSTFHNDDFCEALLSMLCSGCLQLTTETAVNSDSVTVFKSIG